ncbi:MAG TPA: hypothetical protein VHE12_02980 [bacterium]|nr:hypothetical protein [bacterium]
MRWRIKVDLKQRLGDLRIRRRFAFFPAKVGGFKAWLEPFYCVEKCYHVYGGFLGARWGEEYRAFKKEECFEFLRSFYETPAYLKKLGLYRMGPGSEPGSPWYLDPVS